MGGIVLHAHQDTMKITLTRSGREEYILTWYKSN